MIDKEIIEIYGDKRLYVKDVGTALMEYPFYYDGITLREFEKEKEAWLEYGMKHGNTRDFVPLWKRRGGDHESS